MRARISGSLISLCIFLGCSSTDDSDSTDYPGDPLATIKAQCEFSLAHKGCDGKCILDSLNINEFGGAKCPGSEEVHRQPDLESYQACLNTCAESKDCAPRGKLRECECASMCASKLSKRTQGMMAYEADCYMQLSSCQ